MSSAVVLRVCVLCPLWARAVVIREDRPPPAASPGHVLRSPGDVEACFVQNRESFGHQCSGTASWPKTTSLRKSNFDHDDILRSRFNGTRVVIVGDSVGQQLYNAFACHVDAHSAGINFTNFRIEVIPHSREFLLRSVREMARGASIVVFSLGLWYNFDFDNYNVPQGVRSTDVEKQVSAIDLKACMNDPLQDSTQTKLEWPQFGYTYSIWRSKCNLVNLEHYVSDLMRLQEVVAEVKKEYPSFKVVWKSVSPQHWNTTSGQFDWAQGVGSTESCLPVHNKTAAYSRTQVAIDVLGLDKPGSPFEFMDTFEQDIDAWNQHYIQTKFQVESGKPDCTHFCAHSDIMWNWVRTTIEDVILK